MPTPAALAPKQVRRWLDHVRDIGDITDDSLSTYIEGLGEQASRPTMSRWRSGERVAPMGLLFRIFGHMSPEARLSAGRALLGQYGLEVTLPVEVRVVGDLADEVADLHDHTGGSWHQMRVIDRDGVRTAEELDEIERRLDRLDAELLEARAALANERKKLRGAR